MASSSITSGSVAGIGATTDDVISGDTIATATVATDDKVIIQDTNDSDNVKTVTAQSIADLSSGGGGLIFLGAQTASASASLDFESLIDSTYDTYVFHIEGIRIANASQSLVMRTSTDNGTTYDSIANDYHDCGMRVATSGTTAGFGTTTGTYIRISSDLAAETGADDTVNGTVKLFIPSNAATETMVKYEITYNHSTGSVCVTGAGKRAAAEDVDAVQFLASSGNLTSGSIRLYGVSKS